MESANLIIQVFLAILGFFLVQVGYDISEKISKSQSEAQDRSDDRMEKVLDRLTTWKARDDQAISILNRIRSWPDIIRIISISMRTPGFREDLVEPVERLMSEVKSVVDDIEINRGLLSEFFTRQELNHINVMATNSFMWRNQAIDGDRYADLMIEGADALQSIREKLLNRQ